MSTRGRLVAALAATLAASANVAAYAQEEGSGPGSGARTPSASREARKFLAPADQVVAIRAGENVKFVMKGGLVVRNDLAR